MAEKFEKPKGFRKKLENFWYHHQILTLVTAFFVFSAIFLTVDYVRKQDPDMVLAYAGEAFGDQTQFIRAEEDFHSVIGDINGDGKVKLNYRIMVLRNNGTDMSVDNEQHFNYSFIDKNVRLFIIEDKFFDMKKNFFEPLEGLLPDEFLKDGLKNEEGKVCAVPIAGSAVAETMNFARPELYVGIKKMIDTEKHEKLVPAQFEKSKELIRYIVTGEK